MSKCKKKPENKDNFWNSSIDTSKSGAITYAILKEAAAKMWVDKEQYYKNVAYVKGKQWIDFNDIGPTNMSGPPPTSGPPTYEPPSEPKSMRDIYKHAGREKKPEPGDCAPHPQAGIPNITLTTKWG